MKQAIEGYLLMFLMMVSVVVLLGLIYLNHSQNQLALCKEMAIARMNHYHSIKIHSDDLSMCKGVTINALPESGRYRVNFSKKVALVWINLSLDLEDNGLTYMIQG